MTGLLCVEPLLSVATRLHDLRKCAEQPAEMAAVRDRPHTLARPVSIRAHERALPLWRCWAWCRARCCRPPYDSLRQRSRALTPTVRERSALPAVEPLHHRPADLVALDIPPQCRRPRTQAKGLAHRRLSRRYQAVEAARHAPDWRQARDPMPRTSLSVQSVFVRSLSEPFSVEQRSENAEGFCDREPQSSVSRRSLAHLIGDTSDGSCGLCCNDGERKVTTGKGTSRSQHETGPDGKLRRVPSPRRTRPPSTRPTRTEAVYALSRQSYKCI